MVFSTPIFLFIFFPITLGVCYLLLRKNLKLQNLFLTLVSLFFYAWGEPVYILVLLLSIIINWIVALLISKNKNRLILTVGISCNIIILFIFKYLDFSINILNHVFRMKLPYANIALPIGISFFTFQAISYIVDIYRGDGEARKNVMDVALYISFFPQLIAGPIVRYQTVANQIKERTLSKERLINGTDRFFWGLAKKVLIANNMAIVADNAFSTSDNSVLLAWMGAAAYTFQIYFDFSGYSDMAIGLGKIFGFDFDENFNYPYISKSVSEFWRRWHMSLQTWFRDYVYFPLGGSRVNSKYRHIFNMFVVWLLTGIWHGANYTFIIWGLLYFCLLVFEKYSGFEKSEKFPVLRHIYTMFFVVMGWVIFKADNIGAAFIYIKNMFGMGGIPFADKGTITLLGDFIITFIIAAVCSTPLAGNFIKKDKGRAGEILTFIIKLIILVMVLAYIVKGSYNPFIYFNF